MAIDQNSPDRISGVPVVRQDKETSSIMSFEVDPVFLDTGLGDNT